MSQVRIYKPTKNAMQSGNGNMRWWIIEFEPEQPLTTDALMGWSGSGDTGRQVRLKFESKEAAIAFATEKNLPYQVQTFKKRHPSPKNYSDNFSFTRRV